MIFLFGDYGLYNRTAALYGVKKLFDRQNQPVQIITPNMDSRLQRNRTAEASGFRRGSIWSIYDCFTGRLMQEERKFTLAEYKPPMGFSAKAGAASKQFTRVDGAEITVNTNFDGTLDTVDYFESGHLLKRENYDDGGYLITVEYPLGKEDLHTEVVNQQGQKIFELYQIGKYRKVGKVKFVPENRDFLSENEFWKWAFERLVEAKNPVDKFFVMSEAFRRAIQTAQFNKTGVYLLQTAPFDENQCKDILYDHYEKLIFNSHDELNKVSLKFDEKTSSKLYWNNFIASKYLLTNYRADTFPIYLNLGNESEAVNFDEVASFVMQTLNEELKVSFVIEFTLLRNQVDFFARLTNAGIPEEVLNERIQPLTRPWPERVAAEMARSILYIHYQNAEVISLPLATAIACERPILALSVDPLLIDYLDDSNGKVVSDTSMTRLIKQAIYDIEFIKYVAPNPSALRKELEEDATMARWKDIFNSRGIKL